MTFEKGYTHDGTNKKTGRPEFLNEGKDSVISDLIGNSPQAKLWSLAWEWRDMDGTISDFAQCAGMSRTSLYTVWQKFLDNEWIIPSRYEKGVQYYKFNKNHFLVKDITQLLEKHLFAHLEILAAKELAMDKIYLQYKRKKMKNKPAHP